MSWRPSDDRAAGPSPALAVRGFQLLLGGSVASTTAYFASTVAAGYAAFQLTGAATMLGLMSLALGAPLLLFALVGGVVADRLPRRRVLLASQVVLGGCAAVIAALALLGLLAPWHLVAVGLGQGTAFAFNVPARQALVTDLVGPQRLRNAVSLTTTATNACRIVGPALAGLLLGLPGLGVSGVFAVVAGLYGVGIGLVAAIRVLPPPGGTVRSAPARPRRTPPRMRARGVAGTELCTPHKRPLPGDCPGGRARRTASRRGQRRPGGPVARPGRRPPRQRADPVHAPGADDRTVC